MSRRAVATPPELCQKGPWAGQSTGVGSSDIPGRLICPLEKGFEAPFLGAVDESI